MQQRKPDKSRFACLTALALPICLVSPPDLTAQVYRCEGRNGVVYSQMPCAQDAEVIVIEDVPMNSSQGSAPAGEGEGQDEPGAGAQRNDDDLGDFLTRLEAQRVAELDQFDWKIARMREQMSSPDYPNADQQSRQWMAAELKQLETERTAKLEEYAALEAEARRRAAQNASNQRQN